VIIYPLAIRVDEALDQPLVLRPPCDLELVVPALNEEHRLPATLIAMLTELDRLDGISSRIVVVDNGSSDRTAETVDALRAIYGDDRLTLIGCSIGGKGAAVRRGVLTSQARSIGFVDADLATPAHVIHDVVALLATGHDVVIASRRCAGATYSVHQPPVRRVGSWAFRRAIRGLVPDVSDTQCGFKFFSARAASNLFSELATAGFSFDVELLVRAHALGYVIREVPIAWSDAASSSLNPVNHGGQILRELIRLRRDQLAPRRAAVRRPARRLIRG